MTEPSTSPPEEGATSAAAVADALSWSAADIADDAKLEPLQLTVAAVNEWVSRHATTGPYSRELGAKMLGARLWRRRNSADGVQTFTAEGVAYVQRNDPDIAMLLGIGSYAPPVVG